MIKLRNLACAYLKHGEEILMMKRAPTMRLYPNMWSPVGGHLQPEELNDPLTACKREIEEEAGFTESDLSDLTLKYITIRRQRDEIRIQYIYFGTAHKKEVTWCSEGDFFWIKEEDILNLDMSYVNTNVLKHYLEMGKSSTDIYVAAASGENEEPEINWTVLSNLDALL